MAAGAVQLAQLGQLVHSNELMFSSEKIKGSFGNFISFETNKSA